MHAFTSLRHSGKCFWEWKYIYETITFEHQKFWFLNVFLPILDRIKFFCLLWFCSFILLFSVWHNSISKSYKMYGWHSNFINLVGFGWAYYVPNLVQTVEYKFLTSNCFCWQLYCYDFCNSQVNYDKMFYVKTL